MIGNPYQAYKQQSIMTMTACDMLVALYDGIIKELGLSQKAIEEKKIAEANTHLQKTQKMLYYLQNTLNDKVEMSKDLNALYDYFIHVTVQANMKKEVGEIPKVIEMVNDLRKSFVQADKDLRSGGK